MSEKLKPFLLKNQITDETTPEDFDNLIKQMLTDDQKAALGPFALQKSVRAILYPTVFTPSPATFDRSDFHEVACPFVQGRLLPHEQVDVLIDLCIATGVFVEVESEKYSIVDADLHRRLYTILNKR